MYIQIVKFRNQVLEALLAENNAEGPVLDLRICYDNMGSNKITSDLDFTLIRWDRVDKVVPFMIKFYKKAKALLGNYPNKAFDMNFYIATAVVSQKPQRDARHAPHRNRNCYGQVKQKVKDLILDRVDNGAQLGDNPNAAYGLWEICKNYNQQRYTKYDHYMQLYLIDKKMKCDDPFLPGYEDSSPARKANVEKEYIEKLEIKNIQNLVKLAKVFYNEMYRVDHAGTNNGMDWNDGVANTRISDDYKLYIKAILLWMNYFSDESYITPVALQFIWFQQKGEPDALLDHDGGTTADVFGVGLPGGTNWPNWLSQTGPSVSERVLMAMDQMVWIRAKTIHAEHAWTSDQAPLQAILDGQPWAYLGQKDKVQLKKKIKSVYKVLWALDKQSKYSMRIIKFLDPTKNGAKGGRGGIAHFMALNNNKCDDAGGPTLKARRPFIQLATTAGNTVGDQTDCGNWWRSTISGEIGLDRIMQMWIDMQRTGFQAPAPPTNVYRAAKRLDIEFKKYPTPKELWTKGFKPLFNDMHNMVESKVPGPGGIFGQEKVGGDKKIITDGMESVLDVIQTKLALTKGGVDYVEGKSDLPYTFEKNTHANPFLKGNDILCILSDFLIQIITNRNT